MPSKKVSLAENSSRYINKIPVPEEVSKIAGFDLETLSDCEVIWQRSKKSRKESISKMFRRKAEVQTSTLDKFFNIDRVDTAKLNTSKQGSPCNEISGSSSEESAQDEELKKGEKHVMESSFAKAQDTFSSKLETSVHEISTSSSEEADKEDREIKILESSKQSKLHNISSSPNRPSTSTSKFNKQVNKLIKSNLEGSSSSVSDEEISFEPSINKKLEDIRTKLNSPLKSISASKEKSFLDCSLSKIDISLFSNEGSEEKDNFVNLEDRLLNDKETLKEVLYSEDLNPDEYEFYVIQCPRELDADKLLKQKIILNGEDTLRIDGLESELEVLSERESNKRSINLVMPSKVAKCFKLVSVPVSGSVIISEGADVSETSSAPVPMEPAEVEFNKPSERVPMPESLRTKLPSFDWRLDESWRKSEKEGLLEEISVVKSKRKKKKKHKHESSTIEENLPAIESSLIMSTADEPATEESSRPKKKKKKHKEREELNWSQDVNLSSTIIEVSDVEPAETSISVKKKKKKKKDHDKSTEVTSCTVETFEDGKSLHDNSRTSLGCSLVEEEKVKKKRKSKNKDTSRTDVEEVPNIIDITMEDSGIESKEPQLPLDFYVTHRKKKKKKHSLEGPPLTEEVAHLETSQIVPKKKRKRDMEPPLTEEVADLETSQIAPKKKRKRDIDSSFAESEVSLLEVDTSYSESRPYKKKKKLLSPEF